MKTKAKTTIRNASKRKLLDYIADLDSDYPEHLSIGQLRARARACQSSSRAWFGRKVSFEEWANS